MLFRWYLRIIIDPKSWYCYILLNINEELIQIEPSRIADDSMYTNNNSWAFYQSFLNSSITWIWIMIVDDAPYLIGPCSNK